MVNVTIRKARSDEAHLVTDVERRAFGTDVEAQLVLDLMADSTAHPQLSLLAFSDNQAVGHILFTSVQVQDITTFAKCALLAPLAVVPEFQKHGIGMQLIAEGLRYLKEAGVALVFVLGHPDYYPKAGFTPAGQHGFDAPYPIPDECADAWMVLELRAGAMSSTTGKILCAHALDKPEYWRE